jgi:hypothetical protein
MALSMGMGSAFLWMRSWVLLELLPGFVMLCREARTAQSPMALFQPVGSSQMARKYPPPSQLPSLALDFPA